MTEEYYVYPATMPDYREHSDVRPFCEDDTCPCHEDPDNQDLLNTWHQGGLIGQVDGDLIYHGRTV